MLGQGTMKVTSNFTHMLVAALKPGFAKAVAPETAGKRLQLYAHRLAVLTNFRARTLRNPRNLGGSGCIDLAGRALPI